MSSIESAAAAGDQLKLLYALRTRLARALDDEDCAARDLAALSRRLQDVSEKIDTLEEQAKQEGRTIGGTDDSGSGEDPVFDPDEI